MAELKENIKEFNKNVTDRGGYEYSTDAPLSSRLANARISKAIHKYISDSDKTLIDIGCGDGVYTNEIKEAFPQLDIHGYDPAVDAIELAKGKYSNIEFGILNILDETIENSKTKYDVGVIRGVLHHLSDPELAINNALKLAKTVIILEPNGNNMVLKIIERVSKYHRDHEEQSFFPARLVSWCERCGAKVRSKEFLGFVPMFFPSVLSKIVHFFQPLLERIPLVRELLSAQVIIVCSKEDL